MVPVANFPVYIYTGLILVRGLEGPRGASWSLGKSLHGSPQIPHRPLFSFHWTPQPLQHGREMCIHQKDICIFCNFLHIITYPQYVWSSSKFSGVSNPILHIEALDGGSNNLACASHLKQQELLTLQNFFAWKFYVVTVRKCISRQIISCITYITMFTCLASCHKTSIKLGITELPDQEGK